MAGQASLVEVDLPKATALEAEHIVEQLQLHRAPARSASSATQAQSASKPEPDAVPETDVQAVDALMKYRDGIERTLFNRVVRFGNRRHLVRFDQYLFRRHSGGESESPTGPFQGKAR